MPSKKPSLDLEDPYSRPYIRVSDSLAGATHSENFRHATMRVAFMNLFLKDARVAEIFEYWGRRKGLYKAAKAVAQAGDKLALAYGLGHRCQLLGDELQEIKQVKNEAHVICLANSFLRNSERFLRMGEKTIKGLGKEATVFVRDKLYLPWPWLAVELLDSFWRDAYFRAFGLAIQRNYWVEENEPPAPDLELSFKISKGETAKQALSRLVQEVSPVYMKLKMAQRRVTPRGRRPKGNNKHLEEYTRWFFQHSLCRKSIRSLAREYHNINHHIRSFAECDDRATIQYGIKEAKRLLNLTSYRF